MQPVDFWQSFLPSGAPVPEPPFTDRYPARLEGGRVLLLPLRPLSDGRHAIASLIVNQASFAVLSALADDVAARLAPYAPEVIVGLPTLGLTLAAAVAERLGHGRYVPFGNSRKFWYRDDLSVPLTSITTPEQVKRLYVDPRLIALFEGRRVALVDDVVSSGASIVAGLKLLKALSTAPVAIGAAMLQTNRWRERLAAVDPALPARVVGAFASSLLERREGDGWWPVA